MSFQLVWNLSASSLSSGNPEGLRTSRNDRNRNNNADYL